MDERAGITKLLDDRRLYTNVPINMNVPNITPTDILLKISHKVNEDTLHFLSADTSVVRTDTSLFPK